MSLLATVFCNAEQAAREGNETDYKTSMAHMAYIAGCEARAARRTARASMVMQVINMALLAALIYMRVKGL